MHVTIATVCLQVVTDCPSLQTSQTAELWGKLLSGAVRLLEGDEAVQSGFGQDEDAGEDEYTGYNASYAPLHNAAPAEQDMLPDVSDARVYLASSLASFSRSHTGQVSSLIQQHLVPDLQPKLQTYLQTAQVSLA